VIPHGYLERPNPDRQIQGQERTHLAHLRDPCEELLPPLLRMSEREAGTLQPPRRTDRPPPRSRRVPPSAGSLRAQVRYLCS
jgi:hypothetical protein